MAILLLFILVQLMAVHDGREQASLSSSPSGCRVELQTDGGPRGVMESLQWRDGLTKSECESKCADENLDGQGCAAFIVDKDVGG